jgi:hypothetical protein
MSRINEAAARGELAERYVTVVPQLADEVERLAVRVGGDFKLMGAVWK